MQFLQIFKQNLHKKKTMDSHWTDTLNETFGIASSMNRPSNRTPNLFIPSLSNNCGTDDFFLNFIIFKCTLLNSYDSNQWNKSQFINNKINMDRFRFGTSSNHPDVELNFIEIYEYLILCNIKRLCFQFGSHKLLRNC